MIYVSPPYRPFHHKAWKRDFPKRCLDGSCQTSPVQQRFHREVNLEFATRLVFFATEVNNFIVFLLLFLLRLFSALFLFRPIFGPSRAGGASFCPLEYLKRGFFSLAHSFLCTRFAFSTKLRLFVLKICLGRVSLRPVSPAQTVESGRIVNEMRGVERGGEEGISRSEHREPAAQRTDDEGEGDREEGFPHGSRLCAHRQIAGPLKIQIYSPIFLIYSRGR